MSKEKYEVYAMLYKRVALFDNYFIFLPCHYIQGMFDPTDKSITDNTGTPFYECIEYDIIQSAVSLTYRYDITESDLKNMFQTNDINSALSKYYDNFKKELLIGKLDTMAKKVTITSIPFEFIDELLKRYHIAIKDGETSITLSKAQIVTLIQQNNIDAIKSILNKLLDVVKFTEKLSGVKKISEVNGSIGTKSVEVVPEENANQISKDKARLLKAIFGDSAFEEITKENRCKKTYNHILKYLIGQDDAVQTLVGTVLNNMNAVLPKEIIKPLIIGQTGSGKTYFFKLLGKFLDVPVIIVDCNLLVQSGYVGQSIEDVLRDLYLLCNKDIKKTERAIVFLDEIDKLAAKGAEVSDIGVQKALLKFIEGHKYVVPLDRSETNKVVIDTSMMNIAAGGAFETLINSKDTAIGFTNNFNNTAIKNITTEQLIEFGMIAELIGRFGITVRYNNVTREMIRKQLIESIDSPLEINKKIFYREYKIRLVFSEKYISRVIEDAITSNTGFRGTSQVINQSLSKLSFALQYGSLGRKRITITEEYIDNPDVYKVKLKKR